MSRNCNIFLNVGAKYKSSVHRFLVTQSLQFRRMTRRAWRFIEHPIMSVITVKGPAAQKDVRHDGQHDRQAPIQAIIGSEVIPQVKPELFCERKELGICNRSAAFRHHRSDFCLADLRSRRCAESISAAHRKLSASTTIWHDSRANRQRRHHYAAKELPTTTDA